MSNSVQRVSQLWRKFRRTDRHLIDLYISIVATALLIAMSYFVRREYPQDWEVTSFRLINNLPDFLYYIIWPFMQYGVFITIPIIALVALYFKRYRLAILLLFGGIGIYFSARFFKDVFPRGRPGDLLEAVNIRETFAPGSKGFTSGHTAVAATIATFSHYYLKKKWQIASIVTLAIVIIGRMYIGAHLPLDVLGGVALGVAVASFINFLLGVPRPKKVAAEDSKQWLQQHRPRHPGDIIRMVIAALVFAITTLFALTGTVGNLEEALFRFINYLPDILSPLLSLLMQFGALYFVFVAAGISLFGKHKRLFSKILLGGSGVWIAAKIAKSLVNRDRPFYLLQEIIQRGANSGILGFPSGHASIAALIATVTGPYVSKRWSRFFWILAWLTAIGRVFVGAHLPLDVMAGLALGWFSGSLLNVLFGTPAKVWPKKAIFEALKKANMPLRHVDEARVDARGSTPLIAETKHGKQLFIKLIDSEHRSADVLYRLWRYLTLRASQDELPFATAKQLAEHEAYINIQSAQAGVRVPAVLLCRSITSNAAIIVTEKIDGVILSEYSGTMDKELLVHVFAEVRKLHADGIAHRDLRATNVMIDTHRNPWIIDFSFSQTAATDQQLQQDILELIVSLSLIADPEMVMKAAAKVFGNQSLKSLLPYVQPAALTTYTRQQLKARSGLLEQLSGKIIQTTHARRAPKATLKRLNMKWLLLLLIVGLSIYYFLPRLGELHESAAALRGANIGPLMLVLLFSLLSYVLSAVIVMGAVQRAIGFWRAVLLQFATSVANRITPKGLGGVYMVERFLELHYHDRAQATASVSVIYASGIIMHVLTLLVTTLIVNPDFITDFFELGFKPEYVILVAIILGLALVSLAFVKRLPAFLKRWTKETIATIQHITTSPLKVVQIFGGSLGITLAYAAALHFSVVAFGPSLAYSEVLLVYLSASAIASSAPTPGNLGAAEASLSIGLSVFGVPLGQAITAVLAYRLATFWLPIAPGLAALKYLRKHADI